MPYSPDRQRNNIEAGIASFTRNAMFDPLRASRFWLFDVAPVDSLTMPIFQPMAGFSAVSSPEITIETTEIREANYPFTRKVVKHADVATLTLARGVTFYNSDFFNWMKIAISGNTGAGSTSGGLVKLNQIGGITYRRTLVLIHFFRNFGIPGVRFDNDLSRKVAAGAATLATGAAISAATGVLLDDPIAGGLSAVNLALTTGFGALQPNTLGIKVPARAFLLQNCIPVRYKSGSDFDAGSGDVSIQELDIAVEMMEEISLAAT